MSRIHAAIIAILIAGTVAYGSNAAFDAATRNEATPGTGVANVALQARADRINREEQRIAQELKDNPAPDRSPIIRVVRAPAAAAASTSPRPAVAAPSRQRDDDRNDDRDDDRNDDGDDDDHGDDD